MRLFFALRPNRDTAQQFAGVVARCAAAIAGRAVRLDDFHVTLAFLGETAESRLEELQRIGTAQQARRFSMTFAAVDHWQSAAVLAATITTIPAQLQMLHAQLQEQLGLTPQHAFRPHVTLARKVAQAPVLQAMSPIIWTAKSFSLMRSFASGGESAYTVLHTWPLLDET